MSTERVSKRVSMNSKVPKELSDMVKERARKENRTVSNLIETVITVYVKAMDKEDPPR